MSDLSGLSNAPSSVGDGASESAGIPAIQAVNGVINGGIRHPVSVYLVTLNCGQWLTQTLASVTGFAEVVLIDSGSTDDTLRIAESYRQHFDSLVIRHQDWLGFSAQKQLAASLCQQAWLLNLDGDEVVSPALYQDIVQTIAADDCDGLIIPIRDAMMGQLAHPWAKRQAKTRFFRRGHGHYDPAIAVHEAIEVQGRLKRVKGYIAHYGETSLPVKVDKINRYADLKAGERFAWHKPASLLKLLLVFPAMFIKSYLLRRAFLDGRAGLISSMVNAFYAFLKEARLYELQRTASRQQAVTSDTGQATPPARTDQ